MKAAGKQPRFADGKNCAVLVEIGSARTCLPPAAPAVRGPEITEKKFLIRKAVTRKTLRVLGLSRPGGQVVKIMSPRRPKPGETPGACLPPAAPAARGPEITEKKFLIRKAATRKTLRVLGLSRPGGQVVKIMSPRRPKPGETPGRRVSADALQCRVDW